jgi:ABC-2 type transport system ATP-binding protein
VVDVARENDRVLITATDAESVVWQLMTADPALRHLEVSRASLADAFTALVKEAA